MGAVGSMGGVGLPKSLFYLSVLTIPSPKRKIDGSGKGTGNGERGTG